MIKYLKWTSLHTYNLKGSHINHVHPCCRKKLSMILDYYQFQTMNTGVESALFFRCKEKYLKILMDPKNSHQVNTLNNSVRRGIGITWPKFCFSISESSTRSSLVTCSILDRQRGMQKLTS